ncbi:5-oxoprolinase subunit PxpA [Polaribacter aestuariivivens]|uniref:5-oxoprolinase subunit PxpA n=1 Tax=Polaribacter aestuariivivens TaxID=2304626 RepID=UPI003F49903A
MKIDINCDVGEGVVNEHLLFPFISSCNIACGGHFGDKNSIDKTIQLAVDNNVKIGAHPSFPDVKNFGRKVMHISDGDLKMSIENQINLFQERLLKFNQKLHHIKPHGALYNLIAKEKKEAEKFIEIIKKYTNNCFLYVPYNSKIEKVALKNNIQIKYEFFADRNYNDDLSLVSRVQKNAIIEKPEDVFKHIFNVLKNGKVLTISGNEKIMQADTFCVHGDHVNSVEILQFINNVLKDKNIKIV